MVSSKAVTVQQYLAELPEDRREVVARIRELILEHLPPGYEECMNWGMISYEVPLERYPDTYNGKPLMYAALAAQKKSNSLYLMTVYQEGEAWLRSEFEKAGKKLDMGKSCVHFRRVEDLPLELIASVIERTPVAEFIAMYEAGRKPGR